MYGSLGYNTYVDVKGGIGYLGVGKVSGLLQHCVEEVAELSDGIEVCDWNTQPRFLHEIISISAFHDEVHCRHGITVKENPQRLLFLRVGPRTTTQFDFSSYDPHYMTNSV